MFRKLRTYFVTGLLVILPVAITTWLLWKIFIAVDGFLGDLISHYVGRRIPGTGFVATLILILLIGLFASNLLGRRLIALGDYLLHRIPIVRQIYSGVQQISTALLGDKRSEYSRVVLVEYPRTGVYAVAFQTGTLHAPLQDTDGEDLVSVFLPTTPNPTSGFLLLLRREDVIPLPIRVEEAVKFVISGGSVPPLEWRRFSGDGGREAEDG
ncbi:MAG: DUF502 domain-containing protein [Candidatus Eisenbacteria bacterium]|nr:DUF502 domain-containing protein [Candidatus Eisenbacteria bacterium]